MLETTVTPKVKELQERAKKVREKPPYKKPTVYEEKKRKYAGRPKGSKNALTLLREAVLSNSEEIILEHFPKIVQAVCKEATKGNMQAAKLIMDRLIPARKAVEYISGEDGDVRKGAINIVINGVESIRKSETIEEGEILNETE